MRGRTFAFAVALMAVALGTLVYAASHFLGDRTRAAAEATSETPVIVSDFELVDQEGRTVRDEDLRDRPQLVFFGFSTCPDICPTTLTKISAALEELGPDADALHAVLVTVDPERDTPAVLKEYLAAFDPRIVGLTGTPSQVEAALRNFRVYASKNEREDGSYTVDHSTFMYLMGRDGQYLAHFSASGGVEELVEGVREVIAAG
jgi:protein SCO1